MTAPKPLRAGILGLGGYASVRRRTIRRSGAFELVAGFDVSEKAIAGAKADEGEGFEIAASAEQLATRKDLDVVFVSTPAHLHVDQAMSAAKAGKHIFVEKPLSHDLDQARLLRDYCRENKLTFGMGFSARLNPGAMAAKQYIDEGKLGEIVAIDAVTMHSGSLCYPADNWRFIAGNNPGGPLFQCGIHELDLFGYWLGDGRVLHAVNRRDITDKATEDAMVLMLQYGRVPVTLHSHFTCAYRHFVQIFGTEGNLYLEQTDRELWYQRQLGGAKEPREQVDLTGFGDGEAESLRRFAQCVHAGQPFSPGGDEGVATLELLFDAVTKADAAHNAG